MELIELHWSRAYSFKELLNSKDSSALREKWSGRGVYVHLDYRLFDPQKARVAYIGKVSGPGGLWKRQFEHYVHGIGGLYLIPSLGGEEVDYVWKPGPDEVETVNTIFDRQRFHRVIDYAFEYQETIRIHLCQLESSAQAKLVERQLLWTLQPLDTRGGTKTKPKDECRLKHYCSEFPALRFLLKNCENNEVA